jgi:hypothetical protein
MLSLTWEATFAIVGSIVVIVTGIFGYLIKVHKAPNKDAPVKGIDAAVEKALKEQKEFSEVREQIIRIESDIKILMQHGRNSNRRLDQHVEQDDKHFQQINTKVDKLTDILLAVMRDEKL